MSAIGAPPSGDVVLRPMADADLDVVRGIDTLVYPDPWAPEFVAGQLRDTERWVHLVAERDGAVVGHAAFTVAVDEAHVTTVAVLPDEQGSGIGARLVAALCREAVARGLDAMTLEVRASNRRAVDLYRRFGFAPAGVRPDYYDPAGDDGREDALVMWAHDIGEPAFLARVDVAEQEARP